MKLVQRPAHLHGYGLSQIKDLSRDTLCCSKADKAGNVKPSVWIEVTKNSSRKVSVRELSENNVIIDNHFILAEETQRGFPIYAPQDLKEFEKSVAENMGRINMLSVGTRNSWRGLVCRTWGGMVLLLTSWDDHPNVITELDHGTSGI